METVYTCHSNTIFSDVKYWNDLDTLIQGALYCNYCIGNVPYNGFGFQYPRNGNAYCIADFFAPNSIPNTRTYIKNRLKNSFTNKYNILCKISC